MNGLAIFFLILMIIIIIGLVISGILIGLGIWKFDTELNRETKLLNGIFSFNLLGIGDSSEHVTKNSSNSDLILINDINRPCNDYSWTYKTYKDDKISIKDAVIWESNKKLIMTASAAKEEAAVTLETPTTNTDTLNSWEFKDFTWCLKSNNNLCLFSKNDKLVLNKVPGNLWSIQVPVRSPFCVKS